jgi:hypothetical protein
VVTWKPQAIQGVDTVHDGRVAVGLAGRAWLLGPDGGTPLVGDGNLTVELYVDPPAPGAAPQLLETWTLDHDSLHKKCLKRDMVGWGYNLVLPWSTYRPEITHVLMRVCYRPVNGSPLYTALQPVTLSDANQTVVYPPTTIAGPAAQAQAPAAPATTRPAPAPTVSAPPRPQPAGAGAMSNLPMTHFGTSLGAAPGATP